MSPLVKRYWQALVLCSVAIAALSGAFAMYLQPDFMVTMAQQVWACF